MSFSDIMAGYLPAGGLSTAIFVLVALCGLICSFFGYRLWKFTISVCGLLLGWVLASHLYTWVISLGIIDAATLPTFLPLLVSFIGAILGLVIIHKLVKTAIFLASACGSFIFLLGVPAFDTLVDQIVAADFDLKYVIARLIVAAIIGVLAVIMTRPFIIIITAAAGGVLTAGAICLIFPDIPSTVELILCLLVLLLGVLFQFRRKKKKNT